MNILLIFTLLYTYITLSCGISCKDENNSFSDFWFLIKQPKGTNYIYFNNNLALSPHSLNDTTEGAMAHTMRQLWTTSSSIGWMIYNDEPSTDNPNPPYNFSFGHTKGIWMWDTNDNTALILTHSIPLFPAGPSQTNSYAALKKNAWEYGQHAACFSMSLDTINSISMSAMKAKPNIYDKNTPQGTPEDLFHFANGWQSSEPLCNNTSIVTANQLSVIYFAKSKEWDGELYADCIAPTLQTNLFVESWIRGSAEGPYCNQTYSVTDVQALDFKIDGFSYSEYNDHSKWAIGENDIVCASGINRMYTQYVRGGMGFCFQNKNLHDSLKAAITKQEEC
jgi:deoxyribonuclease-2